MMPLASRLDVSELRVLRERLRPWHDTLRALGDFESTFTFQAPLEAAVTRVLWVTLLRDDKKHAAVDSGTVSMARACEGFTLLALLKRLDCVVWAYALEEIWPSSDAHEWIESKLIAGERHLMEQYLIGIHVCATPSDEFQDVCALLQAELPDNEGLESIPVQVEIENYQQTVQHVSRMLAMLVALVERQQEMRRSPGVLQMEIKEVTFAGTSSCAGIDLQGLRYCEQLTKMGVRLGYLPELELQHADEPSREVLDAIRSILSSAAGVNGIVVSDRLSLESVFKFASAAQHSSTARLLDIELCADGTVGADPTELWQWVAYTVFSRFANHRISRLDLTLDSIQDEDVSAIKQILRASHGPSVLLELPHKPTDPWFVTAKRFNVAFPIEAPRILEMDEPITVRVAGRERGFTDWTVIMPGQGLAWVDESDVLASSQEDDPGHPVRADCPQFERIDVVHMNEDTLEPAFELLGLIGTGTKHIDVYEVDCDEPIGD